MQRPRFHWSGLTAGGALATAVLLAAESNLPPGLSPSPAPTTTLASPRHHLTPVEYFRGLLAMTPMERNRELARKSPEDRAVLLAKIQEYETMPRGIREARLCQTELHWELLGLMKLAPDQRAARLREVSPLYLPMVQELLRQWGQVPPATQKALLEKQSFIGVYLRLQGSPAEVQKKIIDGLAPERRAHWAEEMERWQALPEPQRAELCAQFQRFCLMSAPERQETVHALSDDERAKMEDALRAFDRLGLDQRSLCINSFRKFATMAPEERAEFLKNAARWDAMTASERQLWRDLVHTLPPMPPTPPGFLRGLPPMPPGFYSGGPPMPPMPPNVTTPVVVARAQTPPK
jgi:hypothetical protein